MAKEHVFADINYHHGVAQVTISRAFFYDDGSVRRIVELESYETLGQGAAASARKSMKKFER